ncbi:Mn2+ and Fe2+ transporters of the NRAMP family [Flavobacteriaceae bacterium MAR_2010_188]|nr:Mn2+ and Fe2+ transporters of the NRAMP family [Flavobacteriaceae bacterium MAR_2010_188]
MQFSFKRLGPGLLFAGAAIGVSHLVQSTRAGADFGFGLVWALLVINLFKYPFFLYGPQYAAATGETLLDGYRKLGKGILIFYFVLNLATMFTIQTAVTIVTAGIATTLFGNILSIEVWTIIILAICLILLLKGRYAFLDKLMKIIIITLTVSTLIAVVLALNGNHQIHSFAQILPKGKLEIAFLIAFMGWMPAPLDISVWHSLWTLEKKQQIDDYDFKASRYDFNLGYLATILIGLGFIALGAFVMYGSGESFSPQGGKFAEQLIDMYTASLGSWSYIIIGIAAFTTMFSTTLTTLDASPRAMSKAVEILQNKTNKHSYLFWILLLTIGTIAIFFFLASEMGLLIKVATILSFLTAPFFAIINYKLMSSKHVPAQFRPSKFMHVLSWLGIIFLCAFSIWYIMSM